MTTPSEKEIKDAKHVIERLRHQGGHWARRVNVVAIALHEATMKERERCAKVADEAYFYDKDGKYLGPYTPKWIAAAIRKG